MDILFKRLEDFVSSNWAGGTTTQLAIYPQNEKYVDRNFVWRLSSATVDIEESDFTLLPDYDRVLIVLDGKVRLVHKDIREVCLCQFEQDCFSGDYHTKSYGKIRDFNLMIKKGNSGFAQVIDLSQEAYVLCSEVDNDIRNNDLMKSESYFCVNGYCTVEVNGETKLLESGQLCSFTGAVNEFKGISVKGSGKVIRACVHFA